MKKKFTMFIVLIFCLFSQTINAIEFNEAINKDRVIVRVKPKKKINVRTARSATPKTIKVDEVEKIDNINSDNLYLIKFDDELKKKTYNEAIKELEKNNEIVEVYPSFKYYSYGLEPHDSWHLNNISSINEMKNKMPLTSNKVYVGVLDTGADINHEIIKDEIDNSLSYNFLLENNTNIRNVNDKDGHGTHVAGLISSGDIGSGKNIKMAIYKVLDDEGEGSTETMLRAVNHAQSTMGTNKEVKILNMSLGYNRNKGMDYLLYSSLESYDGIAVIAAGNDGKAQADYPAAYDLDNIVSVGSITAGKIPSKFSNYNAKDVDIFAPGDEITSACAINTKVICKDSKEYVKMSGTSMATPLVTGVIAANYAANPTLSLEDVKDTMYETATPNPYLKGKSLHPAHINGLALYNKLREGSNSYKVKAEIQSNKKILTVSGNNNNGQLGLGYSSIDDQGIVDLSTKLLKNEEIKKVQTTDNNIYVITNLGNLYVSGSNEYNQLNQYNKNNSASFVKFNKIADNHIMKNIEFKDEKGTYNQDSIKINLEKNGYYKLGKNSFVPGSKSKETSLGLQYIELNNKRRVSTKYFKAYSKELEHLETNEYHLITDGSSIGNMLNYNKVISYYQNYNKIIFKYSPNGDLSSVNKEYYQDKNGKNTQYILTNYRNIYNNDESLNKQLITLKNHYYYDNNGKVKNRYIYNYNNRGNLKAYKGSNPNRMRYDYVNGSLRRKYKANYNIKGNLEKQVLLYNYIPTKKYNVIHNYTYNNNLVKKKYTITTKYKNNQNKNLKYTVYNGNKKVSYLNRNYYKNKPSKDLYYKYNKYGKLKTQKKSRAYYYNKTYYKNGKLKKSYRWTYNTKGKKVSKKRLK